MALDPGMSKRRALAGALLLAAATALAQPAAQNPPAAPRTIEEANAQRERATLKLLNDLSCTIVGVECRFIDIDL